MPGKVKILPSGRTFPCERNSTLLEAGLSAGLALGYGCSNGNCGECLAKVISGDVRQVSHHDYPLSAEQRRAGHVLMCCHSAVTDVVIEAVEARGSHEIPRQQITARVRAIDFVTEDVALLHLKTPRTNRLRFLAGQHVELGGDTMPAARHAISSCPCDDMNLHFQIPLLADDEFSGHVFNRLKKGDAVNIDGPMGNFVLDENSPRPLVFIAWHTGFAPVRSLIEHAMALELAQDMTLAWVAPGRADRYQDNLCRSWQDAFDNFHYLPLDGEMLDGKLIIQRLNIQPADLPRHDFYISSPKACENIPTAGTLRVHKLEP